MGCVDFGPGGIVREQRNREMTPETPTVRVEMIAPESEDRRVYVHFVANGRGTFALPGMSLEETLSAADQFVTGIRRILHDRR